MLERSSKTLINQCQSEAIPNTHLHAAQLRCNTSTTGFCADLRPATHDLRPAKCHLRPATDSLRPGPSNLLSTISALTLPPLPTTATTHRLRPTPDHLPPADDLRPTAYDRHTYHDLLRPLLRPTTAYYDRLLPTTACPHLRGRLSIVSK